MSGNRILLDLTHHMYLSEWKTIFYIPSRTDIMNEAYFSFRFPDWTLYMPVNFKLFYLWNGLKFGTVEVYFSLIQWTFILQFFGNDDAVI